MSDDKPSPEVATDQGDLMEVRRPFDDMPDAIDRTKSTVQKAEIVAPMNVKSEQMTSDAIQRHRRRH